MSYDIAYIFKAIDQFSAPLKKINESMANFEKQTKKAQEGFKKFSNTVSSTGKFLLKSLVLPLAGAAIYAIKNAEQFEVMRLRLESVAGSAANAAKVMESVKKMSMQTGIAPEELTSAATKLIAAKYGVGAELDEKMKQVAMFTVVSGGKLSADEVSRIFTRIKATKEVSTRMIVALTNAGIPLMKEFQRIHGLSDKAMELIGKKAIGLKLMEPVFKAMTEEGSDFAKTYKKILETTGTSGERIHNILRFIAGDFGDALGRALGFKEGLSGIADKLMDIEPKIKKWLEANPQLVKMEVTLLGVFAALALIGAVMPAIIAGFTILSTVLLPLILAVYALMKAIAIIRDIKWGNLLSLPKNMFTLMKAGEFSLLGKSVSKGYMQGISSNPGDVGKLTKDIMTNIEPLRSKIADQLALAPDVAKNALGALQNQKTSPNLGASTTNILAKPQGSPQQNVNITMPSKVELTQNDKTVGFIPMHAALGHSMGHV